MCAFPLIHTYSSTVIHAPDEAASLLAGGCDCSEESASFRDSGTWAVDPDAPVGAVTWSGVLGVEGELTGDARIIENGALRWENLPIPLRYAAQDVGGHDGAVVVGRILTIERKDGEILATGDLDMGSPEGREAARQIDLGQTPGVSMDLDSVSFEIRVAGDLFESGMGLDDLVGDEDAEERETDEEGRVKVLEVSADAEVMSTTDARIRAATVVAIPAFAGARIALDHPLSETTPPVADTAAAAEATTFARMEEVENPPADAVCAFEDCDNPVAMVVYPNDEETEGEVGVLYCEEHARQVVAEANEDSDDDGDVEDDSDDGRPFRIVAGSAPNDPPVEWFDNPRLTGPTPITVTDDGRVYGHLAVWGTCHTAYTGQCVEPPHSPSGYAYFRTGSVLTAEGAEVPTGRITLDTLHAGRTLSASQTIAHYEDTGHAVADVAAGEDEYGIWLAGALRSKVTPEQTRALRASPLSGDWRRIGTGLELVGALAVNVPGFPVPRPQGLVASGVMHSLVASGMVAPSKVVAPGLPGALTEDDLRYLKMLANRERQAEVEGRLGVQSAAAELAARVRATRVHAMARRLAR